MARSTRSSQRQPTFASPIEKTNDNSADRPSPARETSSPASHDTSHRRTLRPRLSTTTRSRRSTADEEEAKPPARTSSGTADHKRRSSSALSSNTSTTTGASVHPSLAKSNKRNKPDLLVAIHHPCHQPTQAAPPMTRSQRQKLNQVTPSPAQAASTTTSASVFTFPNVGTKKTKSRVFDSIPKGVVDLYPSKESTELHRFSTASPSTPNATISCCSEDNVCSSKALSACYIQSYGKEYCQHMKDKETPIVPDPVSVIDEGAASATTTTATRRTGRSSGGRTTSHSSSSSNLLFEQDSDDCSSGLADASQETPARRRRVWGSTSLATTPGLITAKKTFRKQRPLLPPL